MSKLNTPGVVGVPESTPVDEFTPRPGASTPDITDHEYGDAPPDAEKVAWYATLTCPFGSGLWVLIVNLERGGFFGGFDGLELGDPAEKREPSLIPRLRGSGIGPTDCGPAEEAALMVTAGNAVTTAFAPPFGLALTLAAKEGRANITRAHVGKRSLDIGRTLTGVAPLTR